MKVGVREDSVDAAAYGAQLLNTRILNIDSAWKVSVAVEQTRCAIQRMSCIVDSAALFGVLVSST